MRRKPSTPFDSSAGKHNFSRLHSLPHDLAIGTCVKLAYDPFMVIYHARFVVRIQLQFLMRA